MKKSNTDLFLDRPRKILTTFGIWPSSTVRVILLKLYTIIIMLSQFSFMIFEIIYIAGVWGDLGEVSEASYLLFTQASVCYKVTLFLINRNYLLSLLEYMERETFQPRSEVHVRILTRLSSTIKRLCMFFLTSAITTCTLWAMIPLFDDAGNRSFPFKIWMPFTPEMSPHYQVGYTYQMISIYISAFLFIGVDSVASSMIMFGCAQLDIIVDKLGKIQNIPVLKQTITNRRERLKENNELLIECVKQHQEVIGFIELVENTFHTNIFFQLMGTVVIICNIGLRISIVDHRSVQFFSMLNYMVTMLSQLFLYCWCGHELTIRSEDLRDWLYQSPWYEQDINYRRIMCLAMERMKRPIIFKAGHYISLSRPTFVVILRCSYSYFAVLNRTRSK